jgi:hypothetical protein
MSEEPGLTKCARPIRVAGAAWSIGPWMKKLLLPSSEWVRRCVVQLIAAGTRREQWVAGTGELDQRPVRGVPRPEIRLKASARKIVAHLAGVDAAVVIAVRHADTVVHCPRTGCTLRIGRNCLPCPVPGHPTGAHAQQQERRVAVSAPAFAIRPAARSVAVLAPSPVVALAPVGAPKAVPLPAADGAP